MLSIERAKGRFTQSQRKLSLRALGLNRPLIGPSQCVDRSFVFVKCIKVRYFNYHSSRCIPPFPLSSFFCVGWCWSGCSIFKNFYSFI